MDIYFKWTKLVECRSCNSSIFLNDRGAELIGEASTLSPEPSLIKLHEAIIIDHKSYLPLGKIRYSYGRGFWEEWFLKGERNQEFWLSIDEGDFVLEKPTEMSLPFKSPRVVRVGRRYGDYLATEVGEGVCVGFEGELPSTITIGETHNYIHLSKGGGSLITVEFGDGVNKIFKGKWIDPLTIKSVYS